MTWQRSNICLRTCLNCIFDHCNYRKSRQHPITQDYHFHYRTISIQTWNHDSFVITASHHLYLIVESQKPMGGDTIHAIFHLTLFIGNYYITACTQKVCSKNFSVNLLTRYAVPSHQNSNVFRISPF